MTVEKPYQVQREITWGSLPPLLRSFELWTILLFATSMLFHLVESLRRLPPFLGSPLSSPSDRYDDFRIFAYKFEFFHTAGSFRVGFATDPEPFV